ncbi:uncharacterized protein A1O9_12843 [Exophiala aquamarina CBS 119918]|uniref:Zn(2)-C6 fungal-type domain-containing protein n=1 Tax=Exophiala aquamarina CBS 119918 TaxID=1182545 RepID=A0A072P668_9EURO|nr:uncharacterized protein A1O9_12843 [Exophiala aquamarina CBS 119918]KEF51120.1 hypothetical protein A1O9_12843 [Exophiala aquamarina CBS 119918]
MDHRPSHPADASFDEPQVTADTAITRDRLAASKRGRYVMRACEGCHRRKVKCSIERPCPQCRYTGEECTYTTGRYRKRKKTKDVLHVSSPRSSSQGACNVPAQTSGFVLSPEQTKDPETWKSKVIARLDAIERRLDGDHDVRREPETISATTSESGVSLSPAQHERCRFPFMREFSEDIQDMHATFQSGTSLLPPISTLQRAIGGNVEQENSPQTSRSECMSLCPFTRSTRPSTCYALERQMWGDSTPEGYSVEKLREYVKTYFSCLNPHYMCIDERSFLNHLECYLARDYSPFKYTDLFQFVALINIVVAVVRVLGECSPSPTSRPSLASGWKEFIQAEHLLSHTTWLGNGDILTIQCLYLKAYYCIFAGKTTAAADAISNAVRLCFQIGLHDQNVWSDGAPCEMQMGQLLFWSLYCLDRHVAIVCGTPYLIRESLCRVDKPISDADHDVVATMPSLGHVPGYSPVSYLHATIKWASLCSDICDSTFGINAVNPQSQEAVASLDARVTVLIDNLPEELQWRPGMVQGKSEQRLPLYVYRQAFIINLRANHLRLLLRRQEMVSLSFSSRTAETCVEIAKVSTDLVSEFHVSSWSQRTDRFSSVIFLAAALIPLICILVRHDSRDELREKAIAPYCKALKIIQDHSNSLAFAQNILQRLGCLIDAANTIIVARENASYSSQQASHPIDLLPDLQWLTSAEGLQGDMGLCESESFMSQSLAALNTTSWEYPTDADAQDYLPLLRFAT